MADDFRAKVTAELDTAEAESKERTESGEHIFQTKRRLMAEN